MSPPAPDHTCLKDDAFVELSRKLEDVGMKVSLVQQNTTDLKETTKEMATCIKALSEASIRMQSNQVTREQFYGKIEELQEKDAVGMATFCATCMTKHTTLDARLDRQDNRVNEMDVEVKGIKTTQASHAGMFKWFWGILAALIIAVFTFGLASIYQHLAGV
jgi:small-conductance mechanosensitive channel